MESGDSVAFAYDALGRRISRATTHNGVTVFAEYYIYDGEDIAAVTDASGTLKKMFTHGPGTDEPLMLRKGTSDYFLLADGLGSIIAVVNQEGTVIERTQYQAYGKPVFENMVTGSTASWSTTGNIYSYTGREWNATTGLYYYRARYYDPETGRFIQQDPIGFAGGDTNLYAYVGESPTLLRDPSGLYTEVVFWEGVSWGKSSFGHVSVIINGISYSYGPGHLMDIRPFDKYSKLNNFRNGIGVRVKISSEYEKTFEGFLKNYNIEYNALTNNCTDPVRQGLSTLGINIPSGILPSPLKNALINNGKLMDTIFILQRTQAGFF